MIEFLRYGHPGLDGYLRVLLTLGASLSVLTGDLAGAVASLMAYVGVNR